MSRMDMPVVKPGQAALRLGRTSLPHHVYHVTVVTRRRQRYFEPFAAACMAARTFTDGKSEKRPVWASAYHDHAIRDDEDLRAVARYIVANPLRAGLVKSVADYPFWDAVWL